MKSFEQLVENQNSVVESRYIDAKEPIREKLLFPSPIRSRKGAYQLKTTLAIDSDNKRWVKYYVPLIA